MPHEWVLDANLIALLLLGLVDRRAIGRHRRVENFTTGDFDALESHVKAVASRGEVLVVSPNIWTEVSNLFQKDKDREDSRWSNMLPILRDLIAKFEERYVPSLVAANRHEFRFLGLSDAVLLELAAHGATIVTNDGKLCEKAGDTGISALHFAAIRQRWDDER